MTEWLKWISSTNTELISRAGIGAEGIVMDKNSCLYGTSILVQKTKGVKEFVLEPLGKIQEVGRSGVWFFVMFGCKASHIQVGMLSKDMVLVELAFLWPLSECHHEGGKSGYCAAVVWKW